NQKKNTTNLFMARIWIAPDGMSSALCYKEQTAPDLQIDQHAFAFAQQPILGVAATDEVHGDGLLTRAVTPDAPRPIETDDLRGDARRRRSLGEKLRVLAGEAGLLLELALRGRRRIVIVLVADEPRRPVDDARVDRAAVLLRENQLVVFSHRDDGDGLLPFLALDELPSVALGDDDVLPFEDDGHCFQFIPSEVEG